MGTGRAIAMPTGAQVQAGTATLQQPNAQTLVVKQATDRAVINWKSFSIASGESVVFQQPSARSVALNPVIGSDPSLIFGSLQANGQLFLINPNGVLFGRGASVDVGGIVASTLGISTQDFMAGRYVFNAAGGTGAVANQGTIRAADGGFVALLGKQVSNSGTIVAQRGSVALGAGESMLLDFHGDGLLNLRVNTAAAGARIDHSGLIHADGGRVVMSAQAKNALLSTVLNVEGVVMARGLAERNGAVYLDGGRSGVASVSGAVDVSSTQPGQRGGDARVLGEYVGLFGNATLNASGPAGGGTVLVGGDFQGKNADIPNARGTYIGRDARIYADATDKGDGGKVIVWADETTKFFGEVSARGGPQGGDGGFVEVSGKANLQFRGRVDTTAPKGKIGTLLLDPDIVTLQGGIGDGDNDESNTTFAGSGTPGQVLFDDLFGSTIFESEIEEQSKTADILIQATNSIVIGNAPFNYTSSGNLNGETSGVLALAPNSTLTLETRNSGTAGESGTIDLVNGGFHGANLRIVTSGTNGGLFVNSGTLITVVNQATNIRLPELVAGSLGVSILAQQGGSIDVGRITVAPPGVQNPLTVSIQSVGGPSSGPVSIAGPIDTRGAAAADGTQHGGNVIVQGSAISVGAIDTSGAPGTTASGGNAGTITLNPATNVTLNGNITARGGNATAAGQAGGNGSGLTFSSPVVLGSNVSIDTSGGTGLGGGANGASGAIVFNSSLAAGANDLTLTADGIDFNGGPNTVSGAGSLVLQVAPDGTVGLTDADIAALADGFQSITIGSTTGNQTRAINAAVSFRDPLTIREPGAGGSIIVGGPITGADNASVTLIAGSGGILLNADITTNNQAIVLNGPVTGTGARVLSAGSGSINFGGTVNGAFDLVASTNGTTTFNSLVGGVAPLTSFATLGSGTTVINGGGITATGNLTFSQPLTLGANTSITSTAGSVTFASGVNADLANNNRTLTVNAASGAGLGPVGNTQTLGGLTVSAPQLALSGAIRVNGGGAFDFRNVAAIVFAPTTLIDTDSIGGTSNAGGVFFGPGSTINPSSPSLNSTLFIDASADGGGRAGAVDLGTAGNLVPIAFLFLSGDLVSVNGNAIASQVFISANEVRTDPSTGIITATRPFTDLNDANAALTLSGLTTSGVFGRAPPPDTNAIRLAVPGLLVVRPNARALPNVWLRGDSATPPAYAFAESPAHRRVCYNGVCSGPAFTPAELVALVEAPERRAANAAVLDELRRLLDEVLMQGFAKENVRRELIRGLVLETGPARPGIDEFTGDGVTGPRACTPAPGGVASGVLQCEGAK
jgi:filamentous hemagglutinin family protein